MKMATDSQSMYPVLRLIASFLLMTIGGSAMYATIVNLKPIAAEFAIDRGTASLPYSSFMIGFGIGAIVIGRLSDRFGIGILMVIASIALSSGFALAAQTTTLWQYCLCMMLLCGLIGAATTFAPVVADISHWFNARRGLAVGIVISGTYAAGTLWPPLLQFFIDSVGWRQTFVYFSIMTLGTMLPLSFILFRRPEHATADTSTNTSGQQTKAPISRNSLQGLLCLAGIGCCAAMAMPQVHIVPYVTDLGHLAARGTEMLSLMLGFGIVSRLASGWISDRIGGLRTLLLGSFLQACVLCGFLVDSFFFSNTLTSLYLLSIAFGLSQGGIVPSYAIIIRTFFPATDAGWRIGTALLFTILGMALGGWMAGVLYDLTGSYTLSFANAIAFNVLNLAIAFFLLRKMSPHRDES